jgi:hypothetical protein
MRDLTGDDCRSLIAHRTWVYDDTDFSTSLHGKGFLDSLEGVAYSLQIL